MLRNISACTWFFLAAACLVGVAQPQDAPSNWVPVDRARDAVWRSQESAGSEFQLVQGGSQSLAERLKAIRGAAPAEPMDAPSARPAPSAATAPAAGSGAGTSSVLVRRGAATPSDGSEAPVVSAPAVAGPPAVETGQVKDDDDAAGSTRRTARRMTRETETYHAPMASSAVPGGSTNIAPFSLTTQGPLLTVETEGPRSIVLGKEASYRVRVMNQSSTEAHRVVVSVSVPAWAQVLKTQARVGSVASEGDTDGSSITWDLERIPARSQHELAITLQPTENRPLQMEVDWVFRAASMQASIDVQQPQLALTVDGPSELRYGATGIFKIKLSNPGNGPAEGVTVTMGAANGKTQPQVVGTLAAGENRTLEVEFAAQQAGNLQIQALAQGEGNLRAEAQHEVRVRRAQLAVKVTAPTMLYAGATAQYEIRVANTGDAPAEGVMLEVELPTGIKNGLGVDKKPIDGSVPRWRLGDLPPGSDRVYKMQGDLTSGGENRVAARVASSDQNTATDATVTQVEAIADLKLIVNDPQGPLPVGRDVTYEILIMNRGSKEASNIDLVAQFSDGIEPSSAEGHAGKLVPGQVIFEPIRALPAGGQIAVQVKAKAIKAGNLRFRAELSCNDLETKLVSELTTRFYGTAGDGAAPSSRPASADRGAGSEPTPARR